ncbi:MAG: hypothetical protein IJA94_01790 [Bacilli bacterium]|nr:hypothetical protein [Bacilli bacterium]
MILGLEIFLNTFMALSWVDFVFFMAVLALIILIVTLIYFIKINDPEEEIKNDIVNIAEIINEEEPISIVPLIEDEAEKEELLDLKAITEALEQRDTKIIDMTEYEEEQEQRAIISYDELIEKTNNLKINYEEEQTLGDLTIKKVNLDDLVAPAEIEMPKINVQVISYQKEEAFLEALKKLQEQLN